MARRHSFLRFDTLTYLVLLHIPITLCSTILLLPFPWGPNIKQFKIIGETLVNKGHQVHLLLPSHHPDLETFTTNASKISPLLYTAKHRDFLTFTDEESTTSFGDMIKTTQVHEYRSTTKGFVEICYNVLEDENLDDKIRHHNISLAVVDSLPYTRCYYVLLYRLGIPYVSLANQADSWLTRSPALPSFVPFPLAHPPLTPDMTFWQRLMNMWAYFDWASSTHKIVYLSNDLVSKYVPNKTLLSINQLAGRSLLWLVHTDILIDYPRPLMPNEINIGGLGIEPAKNLSAELESFITSGKDGAILVSFGDHPIIPQSYMLKMVDSLKKLSTKLRIIVHWPFEEKPEVASHLKVMDSVPQTAILSHDNTKLLVTHASTDAQFEALYNGVPMLNFPLFGEQTYNAKRSDYKGYSETLNVEACKHVHGVINKMLKDTSYSQRILKASEIFRSRQMLPREKAAYWIDHVITFGGNHLYSNAVQLPGYKYLMLDIFIFIMLVLIACVWIVSNTIMLCIKRFQYVRMEMKAANGTPCDTRLYQKTLVELKKAR